MRVTIREVSCRKDLGNFIYLPEKIHANHRNWVHPIYQDELAYFDPGKNSAFAYCDTLLLLALRGSETVGRVMGIINHRHNLFRQEKTARFALLETREDKEVVGPLLAAVEDWARKRGMDRIIGPYGFSDQDPSGFLVRGFEHPPTISTYYNHPWVPPMIERLGYEKEVEYVTYCLEVPPKNPEKFDRMYDRVLGSGNLEVVKIRNKRDVKAWAKPAFRLMNEAYAEEAIYGFSPMDEKEMESMLRRYLPLLDPRFLKGVKKGQELAGFVIAVPDFTDGIRRAKGRLLPFGFLRILWAMKRTKQLVLLIGAVKRKYRGLGIDLLLTMEMWDSARKAGMTVIDTHHQLETNTKMRAVSERLGGTLYKQHRVYRKSLLGQEKTGK